MFKLVELNNGRWNIHAKNPDDYNKLPHEIACAILWRSYPTAQVAFTAACEFFFTICDREH